MSVPTLDEWIEKNADQLVRDIETHMEYVPLTAEEKSFLLRMIMTSVRQWKSEGH